MFNRNEEFESYEEMSMQNYDPCMYCPMIMDCSMMQGSRIMPEYVEDGSDEEEVYRPVPGPGPGPGFGPGPGPIPGPSPKYGNLTNQPVGVSLVNGQGVSGILCRVTNREIYLLVYLYQSQFATKRYPLNQIRNIYRFPRCQSSPGWGY